MQRIKVLILRGHPGGFRTWNALSRHSKLYGGYSVSISSFLNMTFTYEDIRKVNPDVLILSDIAGTPIAFSPTELNAIKLFITSNVCKSIIATYATFLYEEYNNNIVTSYDNRELLPLFGIHENIQLKPCRSRLSLKSVSTEGEQLLDGKEKEIKGYQSTQLATCGWEKALNGAKILACNNNRENVIIQYVTSNYTSCYISSMPEYADGVLGPDISLVYRTIVNVYKSSKSTLQALCCCAIAKEPRRNISKYLNNKNVETLPKHARQMSFGAIIHRNKLSKNNVQKLCSTGFPKHLAILAQTNRSERFTRKSIVYSTTYL
ncbi:Glutamine amidotransferase domain-containing protein [Entamoeba marina]